MSPILLTKRWQSNNPPLAEKLVYSEEFRYHLIAFRRLAYIDAELICHTYADGFASGRAGSYHDRSQTKSDALHASFVFRAYELRRDGRSIWRDEHNDITVFIEIPRPEELEAGRHEKIKTLIQEYQAQRNLKNETAVNDLMREKEIKHYVCSVFFHHWFVKNLDATPHPTFGVSEAIARADVAEAQGYRALKTMMAFLKENKFGGL